MTTRILRVLTFESVAWWLATVAWAALIFHLSTPAFGADRSIALLSRLLAFFDVFVSPPALDLLDVIIRKLAHLTEYGIFALLLYRSCIGRTPWIWRPRLAFWCIVLAALYSVTDEYHQSFTSTRGASALDCLLDTVGAAVGMLVAYSSIRISALKTWTMTLRRSAIVRPGS